MPPPAFASPIPLRLSQHRRFKSPLRSPQPLTPPITPCNHPCSPTTPVATLSEASTPPPPPRTAARGVHHFYRRLSTPTPATLRAADAVFGSARVCITEEVCFNVGLRAPLSDTAAAALRWLLTETFEPHGLARTSTLAGRGAVVEVGPRLNFQTAWSANAVTICAACGAADVTRLERSRRYALQAEGGGQLDRDLVARFAAAVHDRMTETVYDVPLESFASGLRAQPSFEVDIMKRGAGALWEINATEGLGFDEQDVAYYLQLFSEAGRNPTNVELFDLAQSNSEHSRHWFFKGKIVIDGEEMSKHLLDVVRDTLLANPRNSVVAFADNSSTIRGAVVPTLLPAKPGEPGPLEVQDRDRDVLFTAETHNFPSGVAPFPGAETGTGGRIRDTAATGIGSLVIAGTTGYAVGNLHIPGLSMPWEEKSFGYPDNLASPLTILIDASNGASDYGNKFGEPVINGFARTYGVRFENGERREFVKPIMFSGGMGQMDHAHAHKGGADLGLLVVKVGGPAYRIGMGGGAASSMMQGDNKSDLDFNAVQRGDAEMAQKVYRVLRACVELGDNNPIVSIHDQGAGGNCNVVKELIYPAGARIDIRKVWVGDSSLSALEIWGGEYQEQFGLLLNPKDEEMFKKLCRRENVIPAVLGSIDGSGRIVLWDSEEGKSVVDMNLEQVLGDLPQKTFVDSRSEFVGTPFTPSALGMDVSSVLDRVLSLMGVGSKRFLTTKVDRSVTGLVAQQQCVGPLQLPLSNFAMTAQSHFSQRGSATSIGERPSLTALSPEAMARISVGEMMTNLAGVKVTSREDIKCEGNWMWAAKLPGDCASLYDAAVGMRDIMIDMGIAVDGGKDSLSMAAKCPRDPDSGEMEVVRAPGTLVVTGYATVDNVEAKVTPDIKAAGASVLLHVDIGNGKRRLGGSSAAQVYGKVGDIAPDVDDANLLRNAFDVMQDFVGSPEVLAYHDISDGGLLTSLLEMGFAGNCGMDISVSSSLLQTDTISTLFAEELGMILEVKVGSLRMVRTAFEEQGLLCNLVGLTRADPTVTIMDDDRTVFVGNITEIRDQWERTSFALDRLQANVECVAQEELGLRSRTGSYYTVPFESKSTPTSIMTATNKPKVAILREEGSNGDREMSAAFHMAGFEAWDVSVRDIAAGRIDLSGFHGVAFVGGFSYADVLDSAKGWAGVVRFNESVRSHFDEFYARDDTFSLGVCNGCQLMALLGRIPFSPTEVDGQSQPRFIHNKSGRYESRFSTVRIAEGSPAIMLEGMGGAQLGVWVSHGEGRAFFPDEAVLERVEAQRLAPLRYIGDDGHVANTYPANPNGSRNGIAGLCSADGRHLALMPHPERTVLKWQWGYLPAEVEKLEVSPWLRMFQNAYAWVEGKSGREG